MAGEFDQTITMNMKRDEAIVLLWYLSRASWNKDEREPVPTFVHLAEVHSLEAPVAGIGRTSW